MNVSKLIVALGLMCSLISITQAQTINDLTARTFKYSTGTLPYRIFVPKGYSNQTKFPLVLFLHGAVGRGNDNQKQITDQPIALNFVRSDNQERWPSFFIAPQCPLDQTWANMTWEGSAGKGQFSTNPSWAMSAVMALVDSLIKEFPSIDTSKLIVTGISMGGFGTWDILCRRPLKFSLAIPICGGGDPDKVSGTPKLANQKIYAYHAADDGIVSVNRTREMVNAVKNLGGPGANVRYTEYPDSMKWGHFSWVPVYSDTTLWFDIFGPRLFGPNGGNGLTGEYFSNVTWSGTPLVKICPVINNIWEDRVPYYSGLPRDNFSVRYTGYILASHSENYTFSLKADDRASLWISNQQLVSNLSNGSGSVTLQAGKKYPIKIDYYDGSDEATLILSWQSASVPKQIVPGDNLFSAEISTETLSRHDKMRIYMNGRHQFQLTPLIKSTQKTECYSVNGKNLSSRDQKQHKAFSISVEKK